MKRSNVMVKPRTDCGSIIADWEKDHHPWRPISCMHTHILYRVDQLLMDLYFASVKVGNSGRSLLAGRTFHKCVNKILSKRGRVTLQTNRRGNTAL